MKESRFDSVFYMWSSFGLAVAATLMMFVPTLVIESQPYNIVSAFENVWPSFIGYMLILLGGIITGVIALPFIQISFKLEKIVLIISTSLYCLGMALVMLCVVWYCLSVYGNADYIYHAGYYVQAGGYITAVLTVLAMCSNVRALLLDR